MKLNNDTVDAVAGELKVSARLVELIVKGYHDAAPKPKRKPKAQAKTNAAVEPKVEPTVMLGDLVVTTKAIKDKPVTGTATGPAKVTRTR